MKLLLHEKILGLITILFVIFTFVFSSANKPEINIAASASSPAVPYFININTASADELETLNGIGPKTAEAIIEYRSKNGGFKNINELCEVNGIGNSTLEKIKDYIKV